MKALREFWTADAWRAKLPAWRAQNVESRLFGFDAAFIPHAMPPACPVVADVGCYSERPHSRVHFPVALPLP
jgi:hypothetical protein